MVKIEAPCAAMANNRRVVEKLSPDGADQAVGRNNYVWRQWTVNSQ
jgi:hypothetical protein